MGKALLIFLIPAIFTIIGMVVIAGDSKPEVREFKESVRPGYETVKAEYDVTASPSYRWRHGGHNVLLNIAGFLMYIISGWYVLWVNTQARKGSNLVIGFFWLCGILCIFGMYSFNYYGDKYHKRFTQEQYESAKPNLDILFDK